MLAILQEQLQVVSPQEEPRDVVYLWPECVREWQLWLDVQTQWRFEEGDPIGLDYAGMRAHLLAERACSRETWACLRACEAGYLRGWRS